MTGRPEQAGVGRRSVGDLAPERAEPVETTAQAAFPAGRPMAMSAAAAATERFAG